MQRNLGSLLLYYFLSDFLSYAGRRRCNETLRIRHRLLVLLIHFVIFVFVFFLDVAVKVSAQQFSRLWSPDTGSRTSVPSEFVALFFFFHHVRAYLAARKHQLNIDANERLKYLEN